MQESEYEGETEVDEVVGKVIKRRKSNNIAFSDRGYYITQRY